MVSSVCGVEGVDGPGCAAGGWRRNSLNCASMEGVWLSVLTAGLAPSCFGVVFDVLLVQGKLVTRVCSTKWEKLN